MNEPLECPFQDETYCWDGRRYESYTKQPGIYFPKCRAWSEDGEYCKLIPQDVEQKTLGYYITSRRSS